MGVPNNRKSLRPAACVERGVLTAESLRRGNGWLSRFPSLTQRAPVRQAQYSYLPPGPRLPSSRPLSPLLSSPVLSGVLSLRSKLSSVPSILSHSIAGLDASHPRRNEQLLGLTRTRPLHRPTTEWSQSEPISTSPSARVILKNRLLTSHR